MNIKNIYIIGFMASGKTKIGKKLASYLKMDFVDLDIVIEQNENLSINDIFEKKGEMYFRELETKALLLNNYKNSVISLGGGTPCFNNNIDFINNNGFSLYLKLPLKIIIGRLKQDKENRPLVKNLEDQELIDRITNLYKSRKKYYEKANLSIYSQKTFTKLKEQVEQEFIKHKKK